MDLIGAAGISLASELGIGAGDGDSNKRGEQQIGGKESGTSRGEGWCGGGVRRGAGMPAQGIAGKRDGLHKRRSHWN